MKSWKLTGLNKMQLQDVPDPALPGPGQLLLRIEIVGVCGSDIHYYKTGRIGEQVVSYPFTVGHECAATVIEAGENTPCLLYTSPSPRDRTRSRMPSSA